VIRRVGSGVSAPVRTIAVRRGPTSLAPLEDARDPELALRYSNGFVTVEISHDALDRYVATHGDVPLPVEREPDTGDERIWDEQHGVRVVRDRHRVLREITTRSAEGLRVRVNFPVSQQGDAENVDPAQTS